MDKTLLEAVKTQSETIGHLMTAVRLLHDRVVALERGTTHGRGAPSRPKWFRRAAGSGEQSVSERHVRHGRYCNCLNEAHICCDQSCPCHEGETRSKPAPRKPPAGRAVW